MNDKPQSEDKLLREIQVLKEKIEELEKLNSSGQDKDFASIKEQIEFILGVTKTGLDIIDPEYNIRYIDPAWRNIYGDPAGKKCYQYFMGAKEVCPTCAIPQALQTKKPVVSEETLTKENNRPVQVTTIPFQNHKGEWLVGEVNVDISKRKKIEEKLQLAYNEMEAKVEERTKHLNDLNQTLNKEITGHKKMDRLLTKLRDCFLAFGGDPDKNIKLLVALCGAMMNPTCALYNRLAGSELYSVGQWNTPPDFKAVDIAEGHICTDVIRQGKDKLVFIRDLKSSCYARTDSNVSRYGLQTYVGRAVKCAGRAVGSLCIVFQSDVKPEKEYLDFLNIVASAISVEEERKLAQQGLADSEARSRALLTAIPDLMFQITRDGHFVNYKGPTDDLYSPPEAFLNKNVSQVLPKNLAELTMKFVDRALESRQRQEFEYQITIRNNIRYYEARLVWCSEDNVLGIMRDITERKKTEDKIRESENLYHNIVSLSPEAIAVHSEGKIIFVNRAGLKLFGAENEKQVIGRPTISFVHPDSREVVGKRIGTMLESGTGVPMIEEKFLRLDGTPIDVEVAATPLIFGGKRAIQVIVRDVTERKKIERMKNNLIRDVSHKLKNPVAMAEMAYDMCAQGVKKQDIALLERAHKIIFNNLRSLRKDIESILNYHALARRKKAERKKPVSLTKTIKTILKDLETVIAAKKIKVKISVARQANTVIIGPNDLKIVLYNLIDNAVKFTNKGTVSIAAAKNKKALTITIKDTGIGMSPADREMIFETFYQKSPSRTGTGLGLAICQEIIDRYHGEVRINSPGEGQGSTATIVIPLLERGRKR